MIRTKIESLTEEEKEALWKICEEELFNGRSYTRNHREEMLLTLRKKDLVLLSSGVVMPTRELKEYLYNPVIDALKAAILGILEEEA